MPAMNCEIGLAMEPVEGGREGLWMLTLNVMLKSKKIMLRQRLRRMLRLVAKDLAMLFVKWMASATVIPPSAWRAMTCQTIQLYPTKKPFLEMFSPSTNMMPMNSEGTME